MLYSKLKNDNLSKWDFTRCHFSISHTVKNYSCRCQNTKTNVSEITCEFKAFMQQTDSFCITKNNRLN